MCNRHLSSEKGWTEVEFGIGNGPLLGFKIFRTLSRLMFLNCGTVLQFTPRGISPSLISSKSLYISIICFSFHMEFTNVNTKLEFYACNLAAKTHLKLFDIKLACRVDFIVNIFCLR